MTFRDDGASAVCSIFDQWETEERAEATTALNREQARIADLDARLNRLLDVYLEGSLTREEYTARKEQMLRDKADAKEKIGQIQTRGAAWLEPARDLVKRANQAEKLMFSDDLEEIRDFLKIAGSNLRLMPPEKYGEQDNDKARVLPEESDQEPTEGRSSARRGGFAARADLSNPKADAVSVPASKSLQINGKSNPASFPPSSSASAGSSASRESSASFAGRDRSSASAVEVARKIRPGRPHGIRRAVEFDRRNRAAERVERETGIEPATFSLGSWHSTTELLPHHR